MHTCLCAIPVGSKPPVGEHVVGSELHPESVAMGYYNGWSICSAVFTNQWRRFIASISVKQRKSVLNKVNTQIMPQVTQVST